MFTSNNKVLEIKAVDLLALFNAHERKRLNQYLSSAYFGIKPEVQALNKLIQDLEKSKKQIDRVSLYTKLFPRKKYNDAELRQLCNQFHKALVNFLIIENLESDTFSKQYLLLTALKSKNDKELYNRYFQEQKNELEHSTRNYHFQYQFNNLSFELHSKISRVNSNQLKTTIDHLTAYCITENLRLACHSIVNTSILKEEIQFILLESILDFCETHFEQTPLLAKIYYRIFKMNQDINNTKEYYELKDSYLDELPRLEYHTKKEITLMMINYCIRQINLGNEDFNIEAFTIYQTGLNELLLIENKQMSVFTYKNIASLAMTSGQYEWSYKFLIEYKSFLPKKDRDNSFQFNLAIYYFRQKNYDEAMDLLKSVEFKDVFDNLMSRRMLLKIYVEKDYSEALESLLDSFSIYLHRQYKLVYHKAQYKKLIHYVKKMIQIPDGNKKKFNDLYTAIKYDSIFPEKNWLMEFISHKIKIS